ncbi:hypothetical protein TNCV_4510831 [Trichonephila clavipes]|nr:hypothetical protein TNCV_4510831 [Trichonephila clavipes]
MASTFLKDHQRHSWIQKCINMIGALITDPTHMEQRIMVSLEYLGNDFLFRTVTRDESWVHHFTLKAKVTSMERKDPSSAFRKEF